MSVRIALLATAVLAMASPALAQETPTAVPVAASGMTEAEVEAQGEAFGKRMELMSAEIAAAVTAAAGDSAKASVDADAVVARYQPEADAFAAILTAFIAAQMAVAPEAQQGQMAAMLPRIDAQIKGVPAQVRDQALAATAVSVAPAVPATPQ